MHRGKLGVGLATLALFLVTAGPAAFAEDAHGTNGPASGSLSVPSPKSSPKMGMSTGAPARHFTGALASRNQGQPIAGRSFHQSVTAH